MQTSTHTPPSQHRAHQSGFTMIELMVTVAIVAILASLAVPSFANILRGWQRDSATKTFAADLQQARSQAIKSGRAVVVCSSTDGTTCGTSNEWNTGWSVQFAADARVITSRSSQSGINTMTDGTNSEFRFLPNGLMVAAAGATMVITPNGSSSAVKANNVTISRVGRVSISKAN